MAQVITLKDVKMRNMSQQVAGGAQYTSYGPAQLLFFTGVRYERYDVMQEQGVKLPRKRISKSRLGV